MEDMEDEDWSPPTYTRCHRCDDLWEPYYGMLSIKDDVTPAIIIYTCMHCMEKEAMGK